MMKYSNYIILFILLTVGVLFKDYIKISTNLLSLFASKDAIEKLTIADNLGYSKEMFILVKGFDKSSKTKLEEISEKLKSVNGILHVQSSIVPSQEIQKYYKDYYPLLASFDDSKLDAVSIKEKLQALYNAQFTSIFYSPIDKNDPLKLFKLENTNKIELSHKGEYMTLENYGYLIRVSTDVSASQMNEAKILYKEVHELLGNYENVDSFAPFYYTVENSKKIQEDVQWIILLSTIVLLIIYYLLLRNIKLLAHTLIALFSSMVFAALGSTILFTNFNILSLAFGMSITAVSIDYLLHYHFHNFYQSEKKIDKNVLYGYLTTVVAFGIFSFIPIPIISQISFFAVMSLSFAYLLFTFVFPQLSIDAYKQNKSSTASKKSIPAYMFFIVSVLLLVYSAFNITLDSSIKNLDYQNEKLLNLQEMFQASNKANLTPIIVQAPSKDELIANLHIVDEKSKTSLSLASFIPEKNSCLAREELLREYDFDALNKSLNSEALAIGFKEGYFQNAYDFTKNLPSCEIENFEIFKSYNLGAFENQNRYYTIALVSDVKVLEDLEFVSTISAKEMFEKVASQMYKDLLLYASIVVIIIFLLLFFSVKKRLIYAMNYILFPISVTLAVLGLITEINLMHIFSLIILIAIGIDYGIYMSNTDKPNNTMLAIKYSLLSTFAAFGVLIFSSIVALNSIGIVISVGAGAIYLLIKVMK